MTTGRISLSRVLLAGVLLSFVIVGEACQDGEPMGNMSAGLEKALPDRGSPHDRYLDGRGSDPLLRNPLVAARAESVQDGATGERGSLGAFKYTARTEYRLESVDGEMLVRVDERVSFLSAISGAFSMELTRDVASVGVPGTRVGRFGIYRQGVFYTGDQSGSYFIRDAMREDHLRWIREAGEPLSVLMTLLQTSVRRKSDGVTTWNGVVAEKTALSLIPQRRQGASEEDLNLLRRNVGTWDDWWRQLHEPTHLEGSVVVDPVSGVLVTADLIANFDVIKGDLTRRLIVKHELQIRPLATRPSIARPANARRPERDRVYRMLRDVVGPTLRP